MFSSFVRSIKEYDDKMKDAPKVPLTEFRTNPYMQLSHVAIEIQLNNLILTYGLEAVEAILNKRIKVPDAA